MTLDHEDGVNANRHEGGRLDSISMHKGAMEEDSAQGTAPQDAVSPVPSQPDSYGISAFLDGLDGIASMQSAQFVTDAPFAGDVETVAGAETAPHYDANADDAAAGREEPAAQDGPFDDFSDSSSDDDGAANAPVGAFAERKSAQERDEEGAAAESQSEGPEPAQQDTSTRTGLARRLWKRPACHVWWHKVLWEAVHIAVFIGLVLYSLWIVQRSVYPEEPQVRDPQQNSAALFYATLFDKGIVAQAGAGGWQVFTAVPGNVAWLDAALLAGFLLALIIAVNRFWVASWLFLTISVVYSVADAIKVEERRSVIVPSDLNFLSSGDGGNLLSFVPDSYRSVITGNIRMLLLLLAVAVVLNHFDCRRSFIAPARHRRVAAASRVVLCCLYVLGIGWFASSMLVTGTMGQRIDARFDDQPALFDSWTDAKVNGAVVAFVHLLDSKVMDEPSGYSRAAMDDLASRYAQQADAINATRTQDMTDSTVIMILSESFTDPTRVPGIQWNEDPMPYLHQLKQQTTSGLMLSSGYGGGTANMEYMSLTGMAMSNFSAGLSTPYQQLVPKQKWAPSFNQMWRQGDSIGIHPFFSSMYGRKGVYKKLGFRSLRSVDNKDDPFTTSLDMIDSNPYVSDAATFNSVMAELNDHPDPEFISVMTMQNHLPYTDWYRDNQFHATDASTGEDFPGDEEGSVNTYAKGVNYTDQAVQGFLDQLNQLGRPVTVIWYGDHYPSVFATANSDPANALALHETDYFIWSNAASESAGAKLSDADAAYSSSNFFMAQAAEHMNAKVSPYLAFLTQMHQQIAAMGLQIDATSTTGAELLDAQGNPIEESELTDAQRQLLDDYRLIQYDVTAGKGYLRATGFMDLPASEG